MIRCIWTEVGNVLVWLPRGARIPGEPGSQKRRLVEYLFQHGWIEHGQAEAYCGSCTVIRSRMPEIREELKPLGFTIEYPPRKGKQEGPNWKKNKTNSGTHRVYRLTRWPTELDIFNDPFGWKRYIRSGKVA